MAEANGAETPHTRTAPESENTSLDPSQTRHPKPEQARRPKITRVAKKDSPNGSAAPINRFLSPRSCILSPTPRPL